VCCECHTQTNENRRVIDHFSGQQASLWGVLQCQRCRKIWDRDANDAHNIIYLGFRQHVGALRPDVFTSEQEAETNAGTTSPQPANAEQTTMVVDTNADPIEQLQDQLTNINVNQH
jgi:transposase